ncbi:MFS transporter [Georgenia muralis]|uniref:Putative MFS transporter n=1 Tax=Georgenia muralis TaxID=154117 RepID=A0A3N5A5Y7_9MICO|nr:MFS transporter [Georgenia muralis]RPF28795.1 putative MFS transporter [Georgenia muralis]
MDEAAATTARDTGGLSRSQRLDRLPFTTEHRRLLVGSGIGWALDAMDVGLISFVMAALSVQWGLNPTQLSLVGSIGFVGMALGASLGGLLADRVGRRNVFALTLLVYGLATGASALVTSLAALLALRLVVGLGLGSELPVASTLVSEYAPARIRGRLVVILEAFWAVGWLAAALIGYFVVSASDDGWRWALALGAVPALYALYVRRAIPESVRFLESRGRVAEAEDAVRRFEGARPVFPQSATAATAGAGPVGAPASTGPAGAAGAPASTGPAAGGPVGARLRTLWARPLRVRTAGLWIVWFFLNFAYYGAFTWLPTLLVASGLGMVRSFEYTVVITAAQLPGYALAAYLIEAWGRRPTLAAFLTGAAGASFLFATATTPAGVVAAGCLMSFFALGAWGSLYAVTPEMYPTAVRGTGAGWAAGFGRIASILAPLSVPFLDRSGGIWLIFTVFAAAFLLAAGGSLLLKEKRGLTLED